MPGIETIRGIESRKVVSRKEWLVARKKFLGKEKQFSKLRDDLNLQRRQLPWVKVEKEYVFDGPTGKVTFRRFVLRQEPTHYLSLHVRTGMAERLRTLLLLGRPFRQREYAHWRALHSLRGRVPRALNGDRAVQEPHGLEVPMGVLVQHRFQF